MSLAPITNKAPAYSLGIGNLLGFKGQVAELVDANSWIGSESEITGDATSI